MPTPTAEQLAKLPAFARDYIQSLESSVTALKRDLTALGGMAHDNTGTIYAAPESGGRINLPNLRHLNAEIGGFLLIGKLQDGALQVMVSDAGRNGDVVVQTWNANSVRCMHKDGHLREELYMKLCAILASVSSGPRSDTPALYKLRIQSAEWNKAVTAFQMTPTNHPALKARFEIAQAATTKLSIILHDDLSVCAEHCRRLAGGIALVLPAEIE
jgi:hypothetical protein